MNDILTDGIKRNELNLLFVIDNSGSMDGEKIGAVNNAIRDVITILPEIQSDTTTAEIKVSALTFSDDAVWVCREPKGVNDFSWKDVRADGGTDYSKCFDELTAFLTKKSNGGVMPEFGGLAPIILFMSDGMPTSPDWETHLNELNHKGWFKVALKYALSIGVDTREAKDILSKFTGNPERVLTVYTAEALRKVINVIAVTSTQVRSSHTKSLNNNGNVQLVDPNQEADQQIKQELEDIQDVTW